MTLLIMPELGFFTEGVPVDFSINALMPFYTSALLTESGKIEPRAKAIMLFVKRWAKDRGICHVAKGHLSPYVWSLLVMYFMQVREDGPLLPALENSQLLSSLRLHTDSAGRPQFHKYGESAIAISASGGDVYACQPSLGRLFLEFVKFYSCAFEWNNEAINVRLGRRARPDPRLPCVVFDSVVDQQKFAPAIEDPLSDHQNLSGSMNAVSLSRLHEELRRAVDLCERGASLTELLTPWAPEAENLVDDAVSDKDA
jgi:DNA polymerase sigma